MALENPNSLDELVPLNPSGQLDPLSEGDDHIRNLKTALKNTFPGLAGRAWRSITRSASGALTPVQNMTLQSAAAGITLTANGASTLGNGWMNFVRAPAAGSVTIAAAEKINGSNAPYVIPAGHIALLMSNGTEFFAVIMYESTPATPPVFPAGTKMVFHQTVPPTGWTKLTNSQYNDSALRMTTGTVGIGGADAFTSTFGVGKATAAHTLTLAQSPPHGHAYNDPRLPSGGTNSYQNGPQNTTWRAENIGANTSGSQGGGASHPHSLNNFNLKFVDVVVAEKT